MVGRYVLSGVGCTRTLGCSFDGSSRLMGMSLTIGFALIGGGGSFVGDGNNSMVVSSIALASVSSMLFFFFVLRFSKRRKKPALSSSLRSKVEVLLSLIVVAETLLSRDSKS